MNFLPGKTRPQKIRRGRKKFRKLGLSERKKHLLILLGLFGDCIKMHLTNTRSRKVGLIYSDSEELHSTTQFRVAHHDDISKQLDKII